MSDRAYVPIAVMIFALGLVLLTGCVSYTPFSAMPELQRVNVKIVDVTKPRTQQRGEPSGAAADISRAMDNIPFPNHRYDWVQKIRSQDGNFECALVEAAFINALGRIHCVTNGAQGTTLELRIKDFGIGELQPGWYGPYLCAAAELKDSAGKQIWHGQTASVGRHLCQKAELENNPKLYREDFAEVADDVAHQLIEGPIR